MARIEFLVEEKSMEELLRVFLPSVLSHKWQLDGNYFIRSFDGKNDLQKSIPKKVKAFSHWREPIGVIVLQDQDSTDCKVLKNKLADLITSNGSLPFLVRIVCRELESWYLGDFYAIQSAYPNFKASNYNNKSKFREPDKCYASVELKKILPEFQKVTSAKKIAPYLNKSTNSSESFQQFLKGIQRFSLMMESEV
jgi:hypothetical protein